MRPSARAPFVAMQLRVSENPTHAFLGQWYAPVAMRKNINGIAGIAGDDLLEHREEIGGAPLHCLHIPLLRSVERLCEGVPEGRAQSKHAATQRLRYRGATS